MKKGIRTSLVILLVGVGTAHAQIQKGNIMVGGDISSFDLSLNEGGNFSFRLNPKAAWFVKDNEAVGAYLNFDLETAKGAGSDVSYGVGGLARFYFGPSQVYVSKYMKVFAEVNAGIEGFNPAVGENTNGLGIGFGPGIAFFVTPNIGLESLLKYNGIIGFGSATSSSRLLLSIGLQVYLPGKTVTTAPAKAMEK